jgi:organic hydroperoxide reductase OsmC/OhrA
MEQVPRISARVTSSKLSHDAVVNTGGASKSISIPAKPAGGGSAINGGELFMLARATCYCNDLYREAQRLQIPIDRVEVEASAVFPGIGLAATDICYHATVSSSAPANATTELLRQTDAVAEVHNTSRSGAPVKLAIGPETGPAQ